MYVSPGDRAGNQRSILKYFRELLVIGGLNTIPVSTWRANNPNPGISNKTISIQPTGTGSIITRAPDGATPGGLAALGICNVDLQLMSDVAGANARSASTQIINQNAQFSTMVGGFKNSLNPGGTGFASYCGIFAGSNNSMLCNSGSGIVGCVILGGDSNQINVNGSPYNFILGGTTCSFNLAGTGSNAYSGIVGGFSNTFASTSSGGSYNIILGGRENAVTTATSNSVLSGYQTRARSCNSGRYHGAILNGGGNGGNQYERYVLGYQSTGPGTFTITQAVGAATAFNTPGSWDGSPNGTVVGFTGTVIGKTGSSGAGIIEGVMWTLKGCLARDTTGGMYFVGTPTITLEGVSTAPVGYFVGCTCTLALAPATGNLLVQVTPTVAAGVNLTWSALVECIIRV